MHHDEQPPPSAAIRAQRLERQRQQRVLQIEQQIGEQTRRVEQCRERVAQAVMRLDALEAALAEEIAAAPVEDGAS